MLRAQVDDLPLLGIDGVVIDVVVGHDRAPLYGECRFLVIGQQLLGALVRGGPDPLGLLGSCDPDIVQLAPRRGRVAIGRGGGSLDGRRLEVTGGELRSVTHVALKLPLNCTGTEPTA